VPTAGPRPGRRRAEPEPRSRRGSAPVDRPAAVAPVVGARAAEVPEPTPPPKPDQGPRRSAPLLRALWSLGAVAGLVAAALPWTSYAVPGWVPHAGAAAVTAALAVALAVRTGGRPLLSGALALLLGAGAVLSGQPVLLAAAAVSTAVVGAVLGVMVTLPAARVALVARECAVGTLVAAASALGANAYDARVAVERAAYLALALSLLGALALAYRLAAGLHGLGRRGVVMVVSGIGLLAVSLAYTEALARWGSPELVDSVETAVRHVRDLVGAVPRPVELLLGFPALAWGVSTRARRRQGWWGTGFGAAGLAVVATGLLAPGESLLEVGLATAYSLVGGLLLGYLVIRADSFLSGARGRRARRLEEAAAHRPEPGRTHALL
jgi:hypothetical protein